MLLKVREDGGQVICALMLCLTSIGRYSLQLQSPAANEPFDPYRTHPQLPEMLVRTAVLALIVGEDEKVYLIWARSRDAEHEWVKLAKSITSTGTKKEAVDKAKRILTGEIRPGVSPMARLAAQEPQKEENGQVSDGKEDHRQEYTPNIRPAPTT
jgi:hypothetical protein